VRVSAIVLNWKDDERTLRCLAALFACSSVEHTFVVDNESSGSLSPRIKQLKGSQPEVWSLSPLSENQGFAGGVNVALQESLDQGFEAVLVINNDATIDNESVELLVSALERDAGLGLVGPRILNSDGSEESAGGYVKPLLGVTTHARQTGVEPDFITWACILVRAEALRSVGLLDERFFMYWEDVDMSFRLRAASWRIYLEPGSTAMHETSTNKRSYPTAIKAYHTWSAMLFSQKYGGRWRVGAVAWVILSTISNILKVRPSAMRGIRDGLQLTRENVSPAFASPLRRRKFGR
jgi:GT2 family glycosyltransferase